MADTTTAGKAIQGSPRPALAVTGNPPDDAAGVAAVPDRAEAHLQSAAPAIERLSKDVQVLPQAAEKAAADMAKAPQTVIRTLPGELAPVEAYVEAKLPITKAMPLVDIVYGGGILVAVVIVQAIGLRLLNTHVDKRSQTIQKQPAVWRVELLFGGAVFMLLGLHLVSVLLWSAAVVYGGVIPDWVQAARFAARSYTTIGSDHDVPDEWHMLGPIIAISGMFTFAWTSSVLVNIVSECNELRRLAWDALHKRRKVNKRPSATAPPAG